LRENEGNYDYKRFHGKYMEKEIEKELLSKERKLEEEERRK